MFKNELKSRCFESFPGMFLTVEGPDGSGKSSMMPHIVDCLQREGIEPVVVRQPGGSPYAEKIRELVLGTKDTGEPVTHIAEALLFAAARAQCLESIVKPAMREGKLVVADRWYDSNFAYQGVGRDQEAEVEMLEQMVEGTFRPNVTFFLNLPLEVAQARLQGRTKEFNRMNAEEMDFKRRTYKGYQHRFQTGFSRMIGFNADQAQDKVAADIRKFIIERFVPAFFAHRQSHTTYRNLFSSATA
jgi:dTMP kinase